MEERMLFEPCQSNGWYGRIDSQSDEVTAAGKKAEGWSPDSEAKILFIIFQDDEQVQKELPILSMRSIENQKRDTTILP
jgi:hypothetical protein